MSLLVIWQYMDRSVTKKIFYMDLRSFGPYNIFLVTDRSIHCHMPLSAMNYLLYITYLWLVGVSVWYIKKWESKWQISFYPSKYTVIRTLPNKKKQLMLISYISDQWSYTWSRIKDASKYTGVTFTNNLSWDRHINNLSWDRHINNLSWDRHINNLSWDRHINSLSWDRHINNLSWDRHINNLSWDRHTNNLSWNRHINNLFWDRHINNLSWDRHINNLSWDRHINNIVGKGNRTLGFIRRILKDCTKTVKAATYTSMVRPTVEYASTVWDSVIQKKKNIKSLEQVQRRAVRFLWNGYKDRSLDCVTNMVKALEWESLQDRRKGDYACSIKYRRTL
jgi:hypothetical protein